MTEELNRQVAELKAEIESLKQDRVRLEYLYSGQGTYSQALINAELHLLNGGSLSLNEIREAIDAAIAKPRAINTDYKGTERNENRDEEK